MPSPSYAFTCTLSQARSLGVIVAPFHSPILPSSICVFVWVSFRSSIRRFTLRTAPPEETHDAGAFAIWAGGEDTGSPSCAVRIQPNGIYHIRRSPNVSRTTNAIALFPLNGNPTVLRCRHPWLRLVCSVGWRSFPVKPHSLLWDQLLKTRIAIRSVSVSIWVAVGMGAIDARLVSQAGRGRHVVKMQRGGGYR